MRGNVGVDDDADLRDGDGEHRRQHQPRHLPHQGIAKRLPRTGKSQPDAGPQQRGALEPELKHAPDQDSKRKRDDRMFEPRREP